MKHLLELGGYTGEGLRSRDEVKLHCCGSYQADATRNEMQGSSSCLILLLKQRKRERGRLSVRESGRWGRRPGSSGHLKHHVRSQGKALSTSQVALVFTGGVLIFFQHFCLCGSFTASTSIIFLRKGKEPQTASLICKRNEKSKSNLLSTRVC